MSLKKDIFSTTVTRLLLIVTRVLQGVIIARCLFPEGKGTIALYMVAFNLSLSIGDLGGKQASAYLMSKEDYSAQRIASVHSVLMIVSVVLEWSLLLGLFWWRNLLNWPIIIMLLVAVIFKIYSSYSLAFALANRWIRKINISQLIENSTQFIGVVIFILVLEQGVASFFWGVAAGTFLTAVYNYSWVRKIVGYRLFLVQSWLDIKIDVVKVLSKGAVFALPLFVFGLNYKVDLFILEALEDEVKVGLYSQGASLAQIMWFIPQVLQLVIFSHSLSAKDNDRFSAGLWGKSKRMLAAGGIALLFLLPAGFYLIPVIYGSDFAPSSMVFLIIMPGVFLMILFKMLNADLSARGRPEVALYIFSIAVAINIVVNLILIPEYGINGAAMASTISYTFASLVFAGYYMKLTRKSENWA